MLDSLTQRLTKVVKTIRGQARLTESNMQDMLREIRIALLEADVAIPVVKDLIARIKEKALGTRSSDKPDSGPGIGRHCSRRINKSNRRRGS